jgi:hypothetical protein
MNDEEVATVTVPMRKRMSTAEERESWIRRYRESGLSVLQFCDEHKLAPQTFYQWLANTRLAPQTIVPAASEGLLKFTEIKLEAPNSPCAWAAELCRPNGLVLRVGPNLPAALLEQLLRVC